MAPTLSRAGWVGTALRGGRRVSLFPTPRRISHGRQHHWPKPVLQLHPTPGPGGQRTRGAGTGKDVAEGRAHCPRRGQLCSRLTVVPDATPEGSLWDIPYFPGKPLRDPATVSRCGTWRPSACMSVCASEVPGGGVQAWVVRLRCHLESTSPALAPQPDTSVTPAATAKTSGGTDRLGGGELPPPQPATIWSTERIFPAASKARRQEWSV